MAPTLDGETRLAAVIGDPVRHSLSPLLHNAGFAAAKLNWAYVALPVRAGDVPAALAGMAALGIEGLSVTMPHKEAVARGVDRLSEEATLLGAVNCVRREGDVLVGENTDGQGFVRSLQVDAGFDVAGCRAVVVGAGGAGRAVALALARAGAERVGVWNRTASKAAEAVAAVGVSGAVVGLDEVSRADLVVNATSIGMGVEPHVATPLDLPFDIELIRSGQVVADLIYHPHTTPLLAAAAQRGATGVGGIGMLLFQAALAFEHWTGVDAPIREMREALLMSLQRRADVH